MWGYAPAVFKLRREPPLAVHAMASAPGKAQEVVVVSEIPNTFPPYVSPCIDCGLMTGSWCDDCERMNEKGEAVLTAFCTVCEELFLRCHVCRGAEWVQPFVWWKRGGRIFIVKR